MSKTLTIIQALIGLSSLFIAAEIEFLVNNGIVVQSNFWAVIYFLAYSVCLFIATYFVVFIAIFFRAGLNDSNTEGIKKILGVSHDFLDNFYLGVMFGAWLILMLWSFSAGQLDLYAVVDGILR
jgi:hypothetical protein